MQRRWVREAETSASDLRVASAEALKLAAFVPVTVSDRPSAPLAQATTLPASSIPRSVVVEIRRGSTTVHANLPLDEPSAAWLREVLG